MGVARGVRVAWEQHPSLVGRGPPVTGECIAAAAQIGQPDNRSSPTPRESGDPSLLSYEVPVPGIPHEKVSLRPTTQRVGTDRDVARGGAGAAANRNKHVPGMVS